MADSRVRYVRNDGGRLAYRVYGDGETTLVWVPIMFSSIDRYDDPAFPWGAAVEQLSREMRLVVWDGLPSRSPRQTRTVFENLGPQRLKGLPDEVDIYRLR